MNFTLLDNGIVKNIFSKSKPKIEVNFLESWSLAVDLSKCFLISSPLMLLEYLGFPSYQNPLLLDEMIKNEIGQTIESFNEKDFDGLFDIVQSKLETWMRENNQLQSHSIIQKYREELNWRSDEGKKLHKLCLVKI